MKKVLRLIAFGHSIFALPFALSALILAWRAGPLVEYPSILPVFILVVVCAVSARSAAMAFNRLIDLKFDRLNPRTMGRELATGAVSIKEVVRLLIFSSGIFLIGAALLGNHCFQLAPFVLSFLLFYSYSKRFTRYSHLILGVALALAPGGAWWVVRPQIETAPLLLMAAVALWVAGFDVIYSCQDEQFDRRVGLYSLPAALGAKGALIAAALFHLSSFLMFLGVGLILQLSAVYFLGLIPIGLSFIYQHSLVSAKDLSQVNRAFFTVNGWISVYFFFLVVLQATLQQ